MVKHIKMVQPKHESHYVITIILVFYISKKNKTLKKSLITIKYCQIKMTVVKDQLHMTIHDPIQSMLSGSSIAQCVLTDEQTLLQSTQRFDINN